MRDREMVERGSTINLHNIILLHWTPSLLVAAGRLSYVILFKPCSYMHPGICIITEGPETCGCSMIRVWNSPDD